MSVERCTAEDLRDIVALEKQCLVAPWSESDIMNALVGSDGYMMFKALEDGKFVGYGGVQIVADEASVMNVAVKKEYRRRGHASALMEAIMRYASESGAKTLYLEVGEDNDKAVSLYEKCGFTVSYVRKNYYGDIAAKVMTRAL